MTIDNWIETCDLASDEPTHVWLVTVGQYDDYGFLGVFSSKEIADLAAVKKRLDLRGVASVPVTVEKVPFHD